MSASLRRLAAKLFPGPRRVILGEDSAQWTKTVQEADKNELAILGALWATGAFASQEARHEEIVEKRARVMPFDPEETTHVFRNTQTAGMEEVVAGGRTSAAGGAASGLGRLRRQ